MEKIISKNEFYKIIEKDNEKLDVELYEPTNKLIEKSNKLAREKEPRFDIEEKILFDLFKNKFSLDDEGRKLELNDEKEIIKLRSHYLNIFYSTNIYYLKPMNENIYKSLINIKSNKDILDKNKLVEDIANCTYKKVNNKTNQEEEEINKRFYSFATKYLYFSFPNDFIIYDSRIRKSLLKFKKIYQHKVDEMNKISNNNIKYDYNSGCDIKKCKENIKKKENKNKEINKEFICIHHNYQDYENLVKSFMKVFGLKEEFFPRKIDIYLYHINKEWENELKLKK